MNIYQEKIYNHLLEDISAGRLPRNKRIPTENELGKMFDTNRMNAYFAVKELERFGVLRRNKRQGTFVNKIPTLIAMNELKSVNTRRVCVLSHNKPQINKIHWNERIINAFEGEIQKNKIDMVFKDISHLNSREEFGNFIKNIVEEGYNSLIIVSDDFINSTISENPEILFQFHNNVFIFNRGTNHWHNWPYNIVSVNLFREGVIAAEYLLQNNYERIIYARGHENYYWDRERERGLQLGILRESGNKIKTELIETRVMQEHQIFEKIKDINKRCAIVARNDEVAARIFQRAVELELEPGVDFGLLGFDDNAVYRELNLTTISPPLGKIGSKLAELVINNINGEKKGEISTICIDSELIIRKTC
jgi:DNA-binding LacI/PurR family transcriptional regulator